jgi:glycogen phosphorylase
VTIEAPHACDSRCDADRAVAELAERLPESLLPLARMAYNYRWSWISGGAALFRDIDPEMWRRSECNPRNVLEAAAPHRFSELACQHEYVQRLRDVVARIDADLNRPWASTPISPEHPVAYVCSEFGVVGRL